MFVYIVRTERIETWAARASELKSRLQQLEGHGEDYGQTNNVEQLKVKIKKLTSRLSKVEKERDDVLNTLNAQSHTPLMIAAMYEHFHIVQYLIEQGGADPNIASRSRKINALHFAVNSDDENTDLIQLLLNHMSIDSINGKYKIQQVTTKST